MTVVQCHGCFDLLHIGHIRHFEAAKREGDYLIVTVTADAYVNKGPDRPVFPQQLRMDAIRALACVDQVVLSNSPTAAGVIRQIQPDVFAKGPDYSAASLHPDEQAALRQVGAKLVITDTEKWSSTALLARAPYPPEVTAYLAAVRAKYSAADVLAWLEKARTLKALVIGDAIRDDYHYCNTLGKAGKEPILAAQFVRAEHFIGGAHAVRSHAEAIADDVLCLTGPMTVKRRFVETYPFQKLFEIYEMDEARGAEVGDCIAGDDQLPIRSEDVVIVADYGHGLLTKALVSRLQQEAQYLAVNTQANAGNHGFNTISKYPGPDFISLSERELRLDARDQTTDIRTLMKCVGDSRLATVLITRGAHGCLAYQARRFAEAPALTTHTVDRVGAGDAVFAVTACCAAVGMPLDLVTFLAAVVGTQAVAIVGNATYIERATLREAITTWLR
jgi:rfaE bifunctional protein nucleotidyltransferase chain/domain